jgi:hypothetical protein
MLSLPKHCHAELVEALSKRCHAELVEALSKRCHAELVEGCFRCALTDILRMKTNNQKVF